MAKIIIGILIVIMSVFYRVSLWDSGIDSFSFGASFIIFSIGITNIAFGIDTIKKK